ncbi:MAG: Rv3235 family protein [Bifidobacteriaceae bacterium]|nr:Rv3235 family protein [Bifidobacteriaceae bacterium]
MDDHAAVSEEIVPGPVRLAEVESRARFIAATALGAVNGYPPSARFTPYLTPKLFKHLVSRAKSHRLRAGRPNYRGRTYLCRINRQVIEATVIASDGATTRAVAMRLEQSNGVWRASELLVI